MSEIESASPDFPLSETGGAQLQALHTLSALGWHYLPRAEVERQRGNRRSEVLLQDVLRKQLGRINRIRYDGRNHPFSEENLHTAIQRLREQPFQGLLRNNEAATDLLQLGISLPQRIDNLQREWSLRYIDWDDWQANAFHMAAEFPVETVPGQVVRPDIVLFVNGIPFAVIEVKSPREDVQQAISQQLRNQKQEDGAPGLFHTVQLLVAAQRTRFQPRDVECRLLVVVGCRVIEQGFFDDLACRTRTDDPVFAQFFTVPVHPFRQVVFHVVVRDERHHFLSVHFFHPFF